MSPKVSVSEQGRTETRTQNGSYKALLRFLLVIRLGFATGDVGLAFQRACGEIGAQVDADEVRESFNCVFEFLDTILGVADAFGQSGAGIQLGLCAGFFKFGFELELFRVFFFRLDLLDFFLEFLELLLGFDLFDLLVKLVRKFFLGLDLL